MQIIDNIRNELLKRNEINALLESEQNPNFNDVKKLISEQVKKPEENIDVYNVKGSFGSKEFKINAYVYDSKEDLEKALDLRKTKKQRKEEKKAEKEKKEEAKEGSIKVEPEINAVEEKQEEEQKAKSREETSEKPLGVLDEEQAPVEEKPEEEKKSEKEAISKEEEAKEP